MKILFAPSERKIAGGSAKFDMENLLFGKELFAARCQVFDAYCDVLRGGDDDSISKMTGLKRDGWNVLPASHGDLVATAKPAILRYSGVAYDALDFSSLPENAQKYLGKNLLIFSNVFGVVSATDNLPNYKLKQGEKAGTIDTALWYEKILKEPLDVALANESVLDLRAGFYDKFYKPSVEYATFTFLKNGKIVSHFAKHYRGLVLRECALRQAATVDELMNEPFENLRFKEIRKKRNKTIYVFEIEE